MTKPQPRFWTTTVPASKTVGEVMDLLREYGSRKMAIEYDEAGDPEGLVFTMPMSKQEDVPVRLEAQVMGIEERLREKVKGMISKDKARQIRARAQRIAWRQLKTWTELVLEMDRNNVRPWWESMMADVMDKSGARMSESFSARFLLTAGDDK